MSEADRDSAKGLRVVVVGGGVTGLSSAWWLARAGAHVTVLDKGVIGWEASSRNGGGASHYHSPLFHEEQRLWPLMDDLLGYPTEYRRQRVIIALTEAQLTHYHYMADMFVEVGYAAERIQTHCARQLAPLVSDAALGGIHLHFGGQANPQRTVQAYAWALQDMSGTIRQHQPALKLIVDGRVTGVLTPSGMVEADAVVLAAGPQTAGLLAGIGIDLPLAAARAEMIVTEPAPLMPIGGVDGNGLYGRQTLRGNLAYGGGPHEWLDVAADGPSMRPTSPLSRNLARRVAELLPVARELRVLRSWAGMVETTPDGRPVLERLAAPANLTVAVMSGVGFGLSPATGRAVRDLVLTGSCGFADLAKLKLERFAGLAVDWRETRGWIAAA